TKKQSKSQKIESNIHSQQQQQQSQLIIPPNEMSGLNARERNKLKRKAKNDAKAKTKDKYVPYLIDRQTVKHIIEISSTYFYSDIFNFQFIIRLRVVEVVGHRKNSDFSSS